MNSNVINGLALPVALLAAMRQGRWTPPDSAVLAEVFGEQPEEPCFYTLDQMEFENRHWLKRTGPVFLGTSDPAQPPGDLEPRSSLIIGDLGPDMPFALDYRPAVGPTVVYRKADGKWVKVAPSIDWLLARLVE